MVRQAKKRKCHTVVCGHIHTPSFKLIDGVYYLNCGDWIENCTHVVLTNNSLELCYQNN
jgi:UDP-2,3-diacylglucosamine pyrophosphatase LpxH